MNRREFVAAIGGALSTASIALAQQQGRTARVGRLSPSSAANDKPIFDSFRAGLRDLGWREGSEVAFEFRFADGHLERLPAAAEELVRLRVDVIVVGSNPGALAAKNATSDIPIVFITTGDPIAGGLVPSLRRPGGNLTGVTTLGSELNGKRLELLKDTFGSRIAVLMHPGASYTEYFRKIADEVAHALAMQLRPVEVRDPAQLAPAFDGVGSAENDAIMVLPDIMFITHRQRLVELAGATRIPTMYAERAFVDAGGLMFYGAGLPDIYRHAAIHVDKILKGAKAADLPVEQPTKLSLVINLKTARALGLQLPPALLARADEVIE